MYKNYPPNKSYPAPLLQTFECWKYNPGLAKLLTPPLMKHFFTCLSAFLFFTQITLAQDTVRFTGCVRYWKTLQPINGTTIRAAVSDVGEYSTPTGFGKNCTELAVPVAGLPTDAMVSVYASKEGSGSVVSPLNGVSVGDMIKISCHILGLQPFPSPFAYLAADINRSGSITTFDITEMRKLILGTYSKLPNNAVWQFLPEYYKFAEPSNPFIGTFGQPGSLSLNEFKAYNGDTIGVFGIKVGDIDGDINLNSTYTGSPQPADTLILTVPNMEIPANTIVEVPVFLQAGAPISGLQVEFTSGPQIKIVGFSKGQEFVTSEFFNLLDTASLYERARLVLVRNNFMVFPTSSGKSLFHIQVVSQQAVVLNSNHLRLNDNSIPALGFGPCHSDGKPYKLLLHFSTTVATQSPSETTLFARPSAPNPFTDKTLIQLELPETMPVLLEVFDLGGRLTWSQEQILGAGQQQLEIPAEAVAPGSMALYRIRAGSGIATGKVVRGSEK